MVSARAVAVDSIVGAPRSAPVIAAIVLVLGIPITPVPSPKARKHVVDVVIAACRAGVTAVIYVIGATGGVFVLKPARSREASSPRVSPLDGFSHGRPP